MGIERARPDGKDSPVDEKQLERFGEVVEQKKETSKAASERGGADQHPAGSELPEEQPSLISSGRTQDTRSPRAKNAGKGKKTADKWNQ